ncbi:hypothetical protein BVY02_00375 [bacterium J17]|nr:hypothetical protein BVY02_00375 [bacterium J17]
MKLARRILVYADTVDDNPDCLGVAMELTRQNQPIVFLLSVLPCFDELFSFFDNQTLRSSLQSDVEKQTLSGLQTIGELISESGVSPEVSIDSGSKVKKIVSYITDNNCDLLIKDVSGEIVHSRKILDSVDRKLIRHCPCPIWLVRDSSVTKSETKSEKITAVAINAAAETPIERQLNSSLIRHGELVASVLGGPLVFLHVCDFDSAGILKSSFDHDSYLKYYKDVNLAAREALVNLLENEGIEKPNDKVAVLSGLPSPSIAEYCNNKSVDTLVMGTVGRSGLSGIVVGNTAERVVDRVDCSLLIVSPKEVRSKVEVNVEETVSAGAACMA